MKKAFKAFEFLTGLVPFWGRPALADAPSAAAIQRDWNESKKELTLPTGISMQYVEMGEPDRPPILLIHGMADSSRSWSLAAPFLANDYRLIMPDLRGHGGSDKPDSRDYSLSLHAADMAALIDGLSLGKVYVAGHSLGSLISQALAINYPEKVLKVALVSSGLAASEEILQEIYGTVKTFGPSGPGDDFLEMFYTNPTPVDADFTQRMVEEAKAVPLHAWLAITKGMVSSYLAPLMTELTAQTLILWGEADELFDAPHQKALRKALPSADFLSYVGRGHNIHWELPDRVADDLALFFRM
ncbi:MAG: alpha/beta hydrolase [Deltaproteobacteria bacterium]|jgi:pimeloyl-ACP methyl ester carboxylesterase|nr:alpha/beta hydrolase [Deltaproteobacteria bacterium]